MIISPFFVDIDFTLLRFFRFTLSLVGIGIFTLSILFFFHFAFVFDLLIVLKTLKHLIGPDNNLVIFRNARQYYRMRHIARPYLHRRSNRFAIDTGRPLAAMIGGGVGIPPMLYLAEALTAAGVKAVAFNGARTAGLLPLTLLPGADISGTGRPTRCAAEFDAFGVEASIATDDGSLGIRGLVTEPFERWLGGLEAPADGVTVYTCGPEPMMRAVAEICVSRNIACQVSLERHMACGMGTCQSCVCKVRAGGSWAFKLCCKDGPVFNAADIIWPTAG